MNRRKSWLALFVAPSVALVAQSVLYSMVTPSCSAQVRGNLHLTAAVALLVVVVLGILAFGESSLHFKEPGSPDSDEPHAGVRGRFLADMAVAVASLSALVVAGMWFAIWVLSPCAP
jgi:hypothetical protein